MASSDPLAGLHWPLHGPTCLCCGCKRHRRRLAREATIEPRVLVDASAARTHIEALVSAGMPKGEVARRAGLSPALVSKVLKPDSSVEAATEARILAVR